MTTNHPLFDNRYRYDFIYPRGRSGETLRAVDTHQHDRLVVIKRPAPQDAPPLRAAQEVSILAEQKALERLGGHPVLTELRGSGAFRAGGASYTYIVMDRAEGETLESLVLRLADQGQQPPELELLVILDNLLDLLATAHNQHLIYNDVDAKHLFWNRDTYRLKVIDWGNSVIVGEKNSAGITVANDIYQVGELIYFAYQGGRRLASETTPEGDYRVDFVGEVPPVIQEIITRATHPNIKSRRYPSIRALRDALAGYRAPLQNGRDERLRNVESRLTDQASQQTLLALRDELAEIALLDPMFPSLRRLQDDVERRLLHLAVQADFDAARIYLEAGNWARAADLIDELVPKAGQDLAPALRFLVEAAQQFGASGQPLPPDGFEKVVDALLMGHGAQAARLLMEIAATDPAYHQDALLVAERMAATLPDLVLLQPHLARLEASLSPKHRDLASQIASLPASLSAPSEGGIMSIADRYGKAAIRLADMLPQIERVLGDLGAVSVERAEVACRRVVEYLRRFSDTAYSQPETAQATLQSAQAIDPANPILGELWRVVEAARAAVNSLSGFRPHPDGSDIPAWLNESQSALAGYQSDLTDSGFAAISRTLAATSQGMAHVSDYLILGRRTLALDLLAQLVRDIQTYNGSVADWLDHYAKRVTEAREVERFARNIALADSLLEGYSFWDNGQMGRAAESARRAQNQAITEDEHQAAERLTELATLSAAWLNEDGIHRARLTDQAEGAAFALFLPDEQAEHARFSGQMPSEELYIKTMKRGLVNFMQHSSTAGLRLLFVHYALRGVMEVQEGKLESADFWREAALITRPNGQTHPIFAAFDGELTRRKLVLRAEAALNSLDNLERIGEVKTALNAPLADAWLKDAQSAMVRLEESFNHWADGEFRAARDDLNTALDGLAQAENVAQMELSPVRGWITPYLERAGELAERRQIVEQAAMMGSLKADPDVLRALEQMVSISESTLGAAYSRQVRLWRDIYKTMLATHLNQRLTKSEKLAEFSANFSALFIDKHPAYRLFKRWQESAQDLPDDEQEDYQMEAEPADSTTDYPMFDEQDPSEREITPRRPTEIAESSGGLPWNIIIGVALMVLVGFGLFAVYRLLTQERTPPPASTQEFAGLSPADATQTAQGIALVDSPTPNPPTQTPQLASSTPRPASPTSEPPTPTETAIIPTVAPTLTPTPILTIVTNTPPASPTATETSIPPTPLPPTQVALAPAVGDSVDVLHVLSLIQPDDFGWNPDFFSLGAGEVWQLGASLEEAGSAPIAVTFSPDFMEALNPDTALRLRRVEAEMQLTLYDENRMASGGVFFGLGIQNSRRQRYSAQVMIRQAGVVGLGLNENGTYRNVSQIPLGTVHVTLAIERRDDGSAAFFINGQQVGTSGTLFPWDDPASLVLYNAGGGMFVTVSSFTIELIPYSGS